MATTKLSSRCSKNRAKIRNMKNWHIQYILNSDKIQNVYRAKIQNIICFIPSATKYQVQLLTCENLTCHCHSADILMSLNWFIDFWGTQVPDLDFDNDVGIFYCTLYNLCNACWFTIAHLTSSQCLTRS